jgi:hypothetical protein
MNEWSDLPYNQGIIILKYCRFYLRTYLGDIFRSRPCFLFCLETIRSDLDALLETNREHGSKEEIERGAKR